MKAGAIHKKILELEPLARVLKDRKKQGKKVVHCHGVFDLVHIGHIRHLTDAKSMGDVLVVTITPDEYVNKGPHRPAFSQHLRAEVLAALDMVDFVAINRWPNAVEAIKLLAPTYYIKGADYRDASKDVTGGIAKEEEAVRSVGGEIRFTDDIMFSSSNLINQHLSLLPAEVKDYLTTLRSKYSSSQFLDWIEGLKGLKVLIVGETILDDYVYCDAMGKSSKEPILAVRQVSYELFAGGVLAIANHLADFCGEVEVLTYLGKEETQENFVRTRLKEKIKLSCIYKANSPTIIKRRFVDKYLLSKMFEVYKMNDEFLEDKESEEFVRLLEKRLPRYDVVIVADYGHGLMTPKAIELVAKKSRFLAVNTQINAANLGFHTISKYPRADYICIHEGEIRLEHRSRKGDLQTMVQGLSKKMDCRNIMVTLGRSGALMFGRKEGFSRSPAFALKVVDRIGSGDAVLAVTSLCAAKRLPGDATAFLGNLVGAQAVMILGNRASIDRTQLLKSVESLLK